MASRNAVPEGARLERRAEGLGRTDDDEAAQVVLELFDGEFSQGYKSDYQRVETRWVRIEVRDPDTGRLLNYGGDRYQPRRWCRQYSGKRYAKGLADYSSMLDADDTLAEVIH